MKSQVDNRNNESKYKSQLQLDENDDDEEFKSTTNK